MNFYFFSENVVGLQTGAFEGGGVEDELNRF